MKLSTRGRYAVMAMADLARAQAPSGSERGESDSGEEAARPVSLNDIAQRQDISLSYLEQLFAKLRRHDLVESVRGPGGGYRLARSADDTRISDIVLAVDEPIRATRCDLTSAKGCMGAAGRCITHDLWEELSRQIHIFLNSVSLADVIENRVLGRSGYGMGAVPVDMPNAHGPNTHGPSTHNPGRPPHGGLQNGGHQNGGPQNGGAGRRIAEGAEGL